MKKLFFVTLLFLLNTFLFAQSSKFTKYFETTGGNPLTGADVYLVPQANTYPTGALQCVAHATRTGMFYRENVPDGEYKIYIDLGGGAQLYDEKYWIGENRLSLIATALQNPGSAGKILVSNGTGPYDMDWNSSANQIELMHFDVQSSAPAANGSNQFYLINDEGTVRPALLPASGGQKLVAFKDDLGGAVPDATATGQLLYSADGTSWTALNAGTDNQIFKMNGTVPNWETDVSAFLDLTDSPASYTGSSGRMVVSSGSGLNFNVNSTAGYALDYIAFSRTNPGAPAYPYTENEMWFDAAAGNFKYVRDGMASIYEIPNSTNVLTKTNTTSFNPSADYQPATKKYVDDNVVSGGIPAGAFTEKGSSLWGTGAGTYTALAAPANGQILTGNTATSTGAQWIGGSKGELLVSDGTGFLALAASTNGYVLSLDNTETLGVKWSASSGGASTFLDLTDSPSAYTGTSGRMVVSSGSGLNFNVNSTAGNAVDYIAFSRTNPGPPTYPYTENEMWFDASAGIYKYVRDGMTNIYEVPNTSMVLTKTNTTSFTPSADYHPATKKYVDDNAGGPTLILKTADQEVTSSITRVSDNHLTVNLAASSTYIIEVVMIYTGSTNGDIRVNWLTDYDVDYVSVFDGMDTGITSTGVGDRKTDGQEYNGSTSSATTTFGASGDTNGYQRVVNMWNKITTSASVTNFAVQWAQSVSDGTATTVHAGSYMKVYKL